VGELVVTLVADQHALSVGQLNALEHFLLLFDDEGPYFLGLHVSKDFLRERTEFLKHLVVSFFADEGYFEWGVVGVEVPKENRQTELLSHALQTQVLEEFWLEVALLLFEVAKSLESGHVLRSD
jgi:hypothetical protein